MNRGTVGRILIFAVGTGVFCSLLVSGAPGVHPEDWELIAEAQDGKIEQIDVKDGWVAWTESRFEPQAEKGQSQAYCFSVYRKSLGTVAIETLIPPRSERAWSDILTLGSGGIVCHDYPGRNEPNLFIPGAPKPFLLTKPANPYSKDPEFPFLSNLRPTATPRMYRDRFNLLIFRRPVRMERDHIVCVSIDNVIDGLSLIPIVNGRPDIDRQKDVFICTAKNGAYELFQESNMLFYGNQDGCCLYDMSVGKELMIWRYGDRNPIPLYLDRDYVYFQITRNQSASELYRYPIPGGKLERMILPTGMMDILDFVPDRIQGILQNDRDCVWVEIDLRTGIITPYNLSVPHECFLKLARRYRYDRLTTRTFDVIPRNEVSNPTQQTAGSSQFAPFVMACDAAKGDLIAVYANRIYRIGRRRAEPGTWASFGWDSTIPNQVKRCLHLMDGDGKEVALFPQETFIAAAIQARSEMAKPEQNRIHLARLMEEAVSNGAQVVVLPETAVTGYMSYDLRTTWQTGGRELSQGLNGLSPKEFAEISHRSAEAFRQFGLGTVFRTVPFLEIDTTTGLYFNSVTLYPPSRSKDDIAAGKPFLEPVTYRKLNPWPFAERGWATKGDKGLAVVDTEFGRMGLLICYDINFEPPNLKAKGIDHLLYSIAWVENKDSDWFEQQLPRIARENNFNIIAANWTVPEGFKPDWYGYGQSRIIDRKGVILSRTDRDIGEKIVYAELPIVRREKVNGPIR
jgi:predicted amidohydrolase